LEHRLSRQYKSAHAVQVFARAVIAVGARLGVHAIRRHLGDGVRHIAGAQPSGQDHFGAHRLHDTGADGPVMGEALRPNLDVPGLVTVQQEPVGNAVIALRPADAVFTRHRNGAHDLDLWKRSLQGAGLVGRNALQGGADVQDVWRAIARHPFQFFRIARQGQRQLGRALGQGGEDRPRQGRG